MRRSLPFVVALAPLALLTTLTGSARAGSCDKPLVSACVNSDTLWPSAGPTRFATLPGTLTIAPGQFAFSVASTYLMRPVVLAVPSPGPTGTKVNAVSDQVNGNFLFGYGVTSRLALHVALPITFLQSGSGTSAITGGEDLRDTAIRDLRFGAALAVLEEKRVDRELAKVTGLDLAVTARFDVSAPTGDRTQFAGEPGGVFAPSVTIGATYDRFFASAELGGRLRGVSQFAGARIGSQAVVGLGLGGHILAKELLSVTAEARALPTFATQYDTVQTTSGLVSTPNDAHVTPAEWMLAVRSAPLQGGDFVVTAGGGTGIPLGAESVTRPRVRALLTFAYAPRGLDSDGDGVLDRDDGCPGQAGLKSLPRDVDAEKVKWRKGCPKPAEDDTPFDFSKVPPGVSANPAATPAPAPAPKEAP